VTTSQLDRERAAADVVVDAAADLVAIAVRSVAASATGVTVAQHRVLVLLEEHGALSVTAVAGGLGVDQSNASRHCSRLVRLGLACRSRASHDGRAVEVRLTARGRTHVRAVREARRREIVRVLDRLPRPSVEAVAQAFALFHEAARAEDRDSD